MKFQPMGARIKVKVIHAETHRTKGGIITDSGTEDIENMELAEVVALGDEAYMDRPSDKIWVKVGDTILFQKYAGKAVAEEGELYRYLRDIDVIAKRID